ncbi:MAG: tRNA (guanosine(37)-N1)-methyltransferase TrmD [Gammaproteobacteria bacterium]|nr:MAG: tRNA (guanosine(37)-N1)-methyltransferase TrmD [Gammaproteobacteria bacterium]
MHSKCKLIGIRIFSGHCVKFIAVTLFPEMFASLTEYGVSSRAIKKGLASVDFVNPREFTIDVHRTVDDRPYGGGPGMVMLAEPLMQSIARAKELCGEDAERAKVVYVSPQGKPFSQQKAAQTVNENRPVVFVAGRYEGIDERVIELAVDEEWSLGDYVLSGGELPAMVMMDTMIRLIPGALGHQGSAEQDSFAEGLLDCPHYTRPEEYRGLRVPDVLLSGNHQRIKEWRMQQSLARTRKRRPDLLAKR